MKKTVGELIDELITTNIKIFMLVDKVMQDKYTMKDAKNIQILNMRRSKLKNALGDLFNEDQEIKV